MSLEPGTRLGLYEIVGPHGAWRMGEVYRARDTKLGRAVALKVLPDALAREAEREVRFERGRSLLYAAEVGRHEEDLPEAAGRRRRGTGQGLEPA